MYGWMGKILKIDLSTGSIKEESIAQGLLHDYLGGRGLGVRLLWELAGPEVDPLSPESPMIFAVGPLTGTKVPTAGWTSLTIKSPLTGCANDSNVGGNWGPKLKGCGYDAMIITGKAQHLSTLVITETGVKLETTAELANRQIPEALEWLQERHGKTGSMAVIGPAGEAGVLYASISVDGERAFGRGGVGTVMGSKNLKAIIVDGGQKPQIADEEKFQFVLYETNKWLKANPITSKGLPQFGTGVLVNVMNDAGVLPAKNYTENHYEHGPLLSGEAVSERILKQRSACYGCPIACGRVTGTRNEEGHGPEYDTLYSLGSNLGIADLELVAELNYLCGRLGLDTISTGVTLGAAMEMAEKGILKDFPKFGEGEQLKAIITDIAYGRGLGTELALGSKRFTEKYGVPELSMQVKGLELPAYDPRAAQGQGLAYATSNCGGCHLRANMAAPEILGVPKMLDPHATFGKAGILIVLQHFNAILDSLVVCKACSFAVGEEYFARLLTAVTGLEYGPQDTQKCGERIWNLERLYNLREGKTKADDTLPQRLLNEPIQSGPAQGRVVELEPMLKEYYRFRSWTPEGVPTKNKLSDLGLEGLA